VFIDHPFADSKIKSKSPARAARFAAPFFKGGDSKSPLVTPIE
jgi:hypothetical protein